MLWPEFGARGLLCSDVFDNRQGLGGAAEVVEHLRPQIAARQRVGMLWPEFGAGGMLCGDVFNDRQGLGGAAEAVEHLRQQIAARQRVGMLRPKRASKHGGDIFYVG